jgi:hypothetical protein
MEPTKPTVKKLEEERRSIDKAASTTARPISKEAARAISATKQRVIRTRSR